MFRYLLPVVAVLFLPSPASGDCLPADWDQAVDRARRAKALVDAKEYDKAIEQLRIGLAICADGKLQRALAKVCAQADRLPEALAAYRKCAETATEEPIRDECVTAAKGLSDRLEPPAPVVSAEVPARVEPAVAARPEAVPAAPASLLVPPVEARPAPAPRSALWNWVGLGAGTAATGLGVAFLVRYGLDRKSARGPEYGPDGKTVVVEADSVGYRNVVLGSVFTAVGVAGVVTSAVLWPRSPGRVSVSPVPGGVFCSTGTRW
jgi:hypothetical protein